MARINSEFHEIPIEVYAEDHAALAASGKNLRELVAECGQQATEFCSGRKSMMEGESSDCGLGTVYRENFEYDSAGFLCTSPETIDNPWEPGQKMQCVKYAANILVGSINETVNQQRPFQL